MYIYSKNAFLHNLNLILNAFYALYKKKYIKKAYFSFPKKKSVYNMLCICV